MMEGWFGRARGVRVPSGSERLDVEQDRRPHVSKGLFVAITLTDHDAAEPQGIRDVSIRVAGYAGKRVRVASDIDNPVS